MNKRSRKSQKTINVKEFVVVATAETMDEARDYETLLRNNDIAVTVRKRRYEPTEGKSYIVMVPEEMADEAHVVIESQDAYDDFYDSELDDEISEEDLDGDVFED
jgi:hypothetical protein